MQQINPETTNPPRLDSTELSTALSQFTGTEHWYRHSLNKRMLYTDGVRYFAKNGGELGAYWLLDKTALEICPLLHRKKQAFGVVSVSVNLDHSADIIVTDGNEQQLLRLDIQFTDLQNGEWRFYLIEEGDHRVMLLLGEY
ncbi:DUF6876 family protein [Methylomonas methanica]|uniref:DUF6876 domain-containing protein n=1 Tax=Methylomonas methanica (strain DSM 25384 / MC09) TaxID=857087 RepID=G0A566_METMM|nr:DUF6876 family protein [Methylomonas methanica]AEG00396.1 hypothetical protein Metme_1985 [Methylomonas methanica MC09]